jgi:hypothetical protein
MKLKENSPIRALVLCLLMCPFDLTLAAVEQGQRSDDAPDRADAGDAASIWPPLRARTGLWLVRESLMQVAGIKSPEGRVWSENTTDRVSRVCYGTRDTRDWWVSQVRSRLFLIGAIMPDGAGAVRVKANETWSPERDSTWLWVIRRDEEDAFAITENNMITVDGVPWFSRTIINGTRLGDCPPGMADFAEEVVSEEFSPPPLGVKRPEKLP